MNFQSKRIFDAQKNKTPDTILLRTVTGVIFNALVPIAFYDAFDLPCQSQE